MSEKFEIRKIWVSENCDLPNQMKEHVKNGGSLYMIEKPNENDKTFVSIDSEGHGLCSYVSMNDVWQEIRLTNEAFSYIPGSMKEHVDNDGKLYQVGGLTESGNVEICTNIGRRGNITLVRASDVEYVTAKESAIENDFADAVANIPNNDETLKQ